MSRPGGPGAGGPSAMSIDAKLAAQVAAATTGGHGHGHGGSSSGSSNANTPNMQQQQSSSSSAHATGAANGATIANAPPAPATATTTAGGATTGSSSHRSKKEEHLLLSLPSNDTGMFASGRWETGDEARCCGSDAEDGDFTDYTTYPRLSNRGNKLAPGSRAIRRGRLGGWDNHEQRLDGRNALQQGLKNSTGPGAGVNGSGAAAGAGGVNGISTKGGASTAPPPHGTLEHNFLLVDDQKKSHSGLPTGKDVYPITPSLTFVPSSSTAAARPDREPPAYSFLPGPNSPTSPSALSPRKRRKMYSSYTGLASTSGSTSNHTSAPVRAYLPVPPQNPIELVMSPLITRTFSPRNNALEKLSLHATDLIERDLPLMRALTRIVDILRGNTVVGLDGALGLPFSGDDERVIQAEEQAGAATAVNGAANTGASAAKPESEEKTADGAKAQGDAADDMEVDKPDGEPAAAAAVEDKAGEAADRSGAIVGEGAAETNPRKRRRTASMEVEEGELFTVAATDSKENGEKNDSTVADTVTAATAQVTAVNGSTIDDSTGTVAVATAEATQEAKETQSEQEKVDGSDKAPKIEEKEADALSKKDTIPTTNGDSQDAASATLKGSEAKAAEKAMSQNESVHDAVQGSAGGPNGAIAGPAASSVPTVSVAADTAATSKSTQASRQPSPAGTAMGNNEDDEPADSNADEKTATKKVPSNAKTRLPASLKRIANPAPYVTSLLVSKENVNVAIPPGAPGSSNANPAAYHWSDLLLPGGEATIVQPQASSSNAPATNAEAGTSATTSSQAAAAARSSSARPDGTPYQQYRSLSTSEQEETVQLCVQELTKFLSDTLEYRDRLGEIRDSMLGVEKRRKGVWTMARSYAHQLLWEEEQDKLAQGL